MARKLSITVNNISFNAHPGEILLDAALNSGIAVPHDCRAGQCGTCLVRVKCGELLGGETTQAGTFHACQARVFSDADITYDKVPAIRCARGTLASIERLAPEIRGLRIIADSAMRHRPGQYYRVKFRGYPIRCFSPTPPFVGSDDSKTLRFHVKLVRDGRVTSCLETHIQPGHRVTLEGPFGAAFFRPGEGRRLVLVASGTGFAPIWAIAKASLQRQPHIPLLLLAGSRRLSTLYAAPALCQLATYPAANFIATTEDAQLSSEIIRAGTPADHLPPLAPTDVVYAAGSPKLVETVGQAAARARASFYADAFVASSAPDEPWFSWLVEKIPRCDVRSRISEWIFHNTSSGKSQFSRTALRDGIGLVDNMETDSRRQSSHGRFWREVA